MWHDSDFRIAEALVDFDFDKNVDALVSELEFNQFRDCLIAAKGALHECQPTEAISSLMDAELIASSELRSLSYIRSISSEEYCSRQAARCVVAHTRLRVLLGNSVAKTCARHASGHTSSATYSYEMLGAISRLYNSHK